MENYVTLSLEKYDELNLKAKKFDELKEKFGENIETQVKSAIDGLVNCLEHIANDMEEENQENNKEKEGNENE